MGQRMELGRGGGSTNSANLGPMATQDARSQKAQQLRSLPSSSCCKNKPWHFSFEKPRITALPGAVISFTLHHELLGLNSLAFASWSLRHSLRVFWATPHAQGGLLSRLWFASPQPNFATGVVQGPCSSWDCSHQLRAPAMQPQRLFKEQNQITCNNIAS